MTCGIGTDKNKFIIIKLIEPVEITAYNIPRMKQDKSIPEMIPSAC